MLSKYVVSFFFSGFFFGIGLDPEQTIIDSLITLVETVNPQGAIFIKIISLIIGIIFLVGTLLVIWFESEYIGLIGIISSFIFGALYGFTFAIGWFILFIIEFIIVILAERFNIINNSKI